MNGFFTEGLTIFFSVLLVANLKVTLISYNRSILKLFAILFGFGTFILIIIVMGSWKIELFFDFYALP